MRFAYFITSSLQHGAVAFLVIRLADHGERDLRKIKYATRQLEDVLRCDLVIRGEHLLDRLHLAAQQFTAADSHHAVARALQPHEQGGLDLLAAAGQLVRRGAVFAELVQLAYDQFERLVLGFRAQAGVDR